MSTYIIHYFHLHPWGERMLELEASNQDDAYWKWLCEIEHRLDRYELSEIEHEN